MSEIPMRSLRLDHIDWPDNDRKSFDPQALAALKDSISVYGVKQPIGVIETSGDRFGGIWGHRRHKAAVLAGLAEIPAMVHPASMSQVDASEIRLLENLARQDLNPIDVAHAFRQLLDGGRTAAEVAKRVGITAPTITRSVSLLTLSDGIQRKVSAGEISAAAGYELAMVNDLSLRDQLATQVLAGGLKRDDIARIRRQSTQHVESLPERGKTSRATAVLGQRTVTVQSANLNLDVLIETLQDALSRAKKARAQQLTLATFLHALRDVAKA